MRNETCLKCGSSKQVVLVKHPFYRYGCKVCGIGWSGLNKRVYNAMMREMLSAREESYYSYSRRSDMPARRDALAAIEKYLEQHKIDVCKFERKFSVKEMVV